MMRRVHFLGSDLTHRYFKPSKRKIQKKYSYQYLRASVHQHNTVLTYLLSLVVDQL